MAWWGSIVSKTEHGALKELASELVPKVMAEMAPR